MFDPLASIRALIEQAVQRWCGFNCDPVSVCNCRAHAMYRDISEGLSAVLASVPPYPEESVALRILQEQKDLEAHTRAVTDVDRLTQIRDTLLKP